MTKIADPIVEAIDAYHGGQQDAPRAYLGASIIGHNCDRWLWLNFRWAVVQKFPGRIKRLFRRGQHEESWVVADLRAADYTVTECLQHQKHHLLAPHIGCAPDGKVSNLPQSKKVHSLEIKTHALQSFSDLEKQGVEKSKPMHWAQMQMEMKAQATDRALYVAVCKDNDEIYTERVKVDYKAQEAILDRGKRITLANNMPEPMAGASASWYECKYCPGMDQCWGSKLTKEVNCRTCCHSTAMPDGTWTCAKYECDIPEENQREGCEAHVLHPDLVPWLLDYELSTADMAVWNIEGKKVSNGEADATVFGSKELVANWQACIDPLTQSLREELGARVTG